MVTAFVFISAVPERQSDVLRVAIDRTEVLECHRLVGGELLVRLSCADLAGVHQFVADQLRNEGVEIRIERVEETLKAPGAVPAADDDARADVEKVAQTAAGPEGEDAPAESNPRTDAGDAGDATQAGEADDADDAREAAARLVADDAVYAADEDTPVPPPVPSASPSSRRGGASPPRPLTNRERDVIRALAAVVWVDGHADPSELQIVDQVISGYAVSTEQRKELASFVRTERGLESDMALDRLNAEDRELLLTNAAIITHADGVQLPSEKTILGRLGKLLGYSEEQATVIVQSAVEEGAISLSSRALEDEPE